MDMSMNTIIGFGTLPGACEDFIYSWMGGAGWRGDAPVTLGVASNGN